MTGLRFRDAQRNRTLRWISRGGALASGDAVAGTPTLSPPLDHERRAQGARAVFEEARKS